MSSRVPHNLRKEAAQKSGGTAADISVPLARRQQGEQTMIGVLKKEKKNNRFSHL